MENFLSFLLLVLASVAIFVEPQPFSPVAIPNLPYPYPYTPPIKYKKVKNLNEQCADRAECRPAFSICSNKICTCPPGFSASNGNCITTTYSCPLGEPLKTNGVIRTCTRRQVEIQSRQPVSSMYPGMQDYQFVDSCGDGYMCVAEAQNSYAFPLSITGHCCQKPKSSCPMGLPTNQKCYGPVIYGSTGMALPDPTRCDMTTHYCLSNTFNGVDAEAVCCPKACLDDEVYGNGKCYGLVQLGDRCDLDGQCPMGQCINGVCSCRKGEIKDYNGAYCSRPYCGGNDFYWSTSGYLDPADSNPVMTANGDLMPCGVGGSQCGANAFCSMRYSVCCPKPKLRCPPNPIFSPMVNPFQQPQPGPILPESSRCLPIPSRMTCGVNSTCNVLYAHLTSAGTIEVSGVCCPNPVYPNYPGQVAMPYTGQNSSFAGGQQGFPNSQPSPQVNAQGWSGAAGANAWQNIQNRP